VMIIRKTKIIRKKLVLLLAMVVSLCLVSVTAMFPVENLFVNFSSPESVFNYTCSGKIESILYGSNSSMICCATGNSAYSHTFVLKSKAGYKIPGYFSARRVSHKQDKDRIFNVYHVLGTEDYYINGVVKAEENEMSVFDGNDEKVESDIIKLKNTNFIYFFVENFTVEHYLRIHDEKITISG
jgi:hypothetical protein